MRLLIQGQHLLETGRLDVKVPDPDFIFEFSKLPADEMLPAAEAAFTAFDAVTSVLPPEPNRKAVDKFVQQARLDAVRAARL